MVKNLPPLANTFRRVAVHTKRTMKIMVILIYMCVVDSLILEKSFPILLKIAEMGQKTTKGLL